MKIIFLDVDGVLNSLGNIEYSGRIPLDKRCFKLLSKIVKETNALIVLHSGWRFWFDDDMCPMTPEAEEFIELFSEYGLKLHDKTPDFCTEEIKKTRKFGLVKAKEIFAWLDMHQDVEKYIVLEDLDLNNDEINRHQVTTDGTKGLSDENVRQAIKCLTAPDAAT